MDVGSDTRGVSEVIGAILVFGLIVTLMSMLQMYGVPAANQQVEFNHNQQLQDDFIQFHENALTTASSGEPLSTVIDLGVRYPTRMVFFNPPPAGGSVETTEPASMELHNVTATGVGASQHIDGDLSIPMARSLVYESGYNEYDAAPTTRYEYGALYNQHDDGQLLANSGSVVSGGDISLMLPAGDLQESSADSVSLDGNPVSANQNAVTVRNDSSGPLTLELPSKMNTSLWEEALDPNSIQNVTRDGDAVRITLEPGLYTLRMARIGVGDNPAEQTPAYLHPVDGAQIEVKQNQPKLIDIEVRDRLNNPITNTNVSVGVAPDDPGTIPAESVQTDADGIATFEFRAPGQPQSVDIRAAIGDEPIDGSFDSGNPQHLHIEALVTEFAGGVGDPPQIESVSTDYSCGSGGLGDFFDDPVDTTFGEDDFGAGYDVSVGMGAEDDFGIDTIELRLRRTGGLIVDTDTYGIGGDASVDSLEGTLVDSENCGTYDLRVITESTGGARNSTTVGVN